MEVPAAGVKTLEFNVEEGDFVLHGDPQAKSVRMNVSIDRFFLFKLGEQDILKRLIKVSGEGTGTLHIATDIPRSVASWGRAEYPIDFEVVVPAGVKLNVRDTSGVIEIGDMGAEVNIEDTSGTLRVSRVAGALRVRKESGDIDVQQVQGPATIQSRSGQMRLAKLGALAIESSDGNLHITEVQSARIQNEGGNIRVYGVRGEVEINDASGEIDVRDVAGAVSIRDTSGQVHTARTGPVTVRDTSGDLKVERAPSLQVLEKESGEVIVTGVTGEVQAPPQFKIKRKG